MREEPRLTQIDCQADPEQISYANLLYWGAWIAIAILVVTYILYVTGLISPHISLVDIPKYWSMSVGEYLEQSGAPHGWGWVALLGRGDYLNFVGIALLAAMTIVCFLVALLPGYAKKRDWLYVGIVVAEVIILVTAASGILGGGGH